MSTLQTDPPRVLEKREAESLRDLTPHQWKSGIAAWLGWFFDGLDMHIYTLVATTFVAQLMHSSQSDPAVNQNAGWIQAAFLVGWALGGGFFGRLGDLFGRSRTLALTILTYSLFTGLSFFATHWWHLLIFRFLAALGIGGEWAVGSSLLSETWPRRWRAWVAAVLQTGVNVGVLLACLANFLMAGVQQKKWVFLVGIVPALIVYWIRRAVPEPAEWHTARVDAAGNPPGIGQLFRGEVRRITILTIIVCATSLTGWWAFMFWHVQHLKTLPDVQPWAPKRKDELVSFAFFLVIGWSIVGNFFAAWLARLLGYRRTIALMSLMFVIIIAGTYWQVRDYKSMLFWIPWVGFCSGMFGLFAKVGDFRIALLAAGFLFIPAMFFAMLLPDLHDNSPQPT